MINICLSCIICAWWGCWLLVSCVLFGMPPVSFAIWCWRLADVQLQDQRAQQNVCSCEYSLISWILIVRRGIPHQFLQVDFSPVLLLRLHIVFLSTAFTKVEITNQIRFWLGLGWHALQTSGCRSDLAEWTGSQAVAWPLAGPFE